MSKHKPKAEEAKTTSSAIEIPDEFMAAHIEQRRREAELGLVTSRLKEIDDFQRDPTAIGTAYVEGLKKRRAELLRTPPAAQVSSDVRTSPAEWLVARLAPFFNPWIAVNLPYMADGINETPGVPGTRGEIEGNVGPGEVGYGANLHDDGTADPYTEKWWIHNWTCSYVFPAAPFDGRLFYRFTVDTSCLIYNEGSAYSGLIQEFVTIGKTADTVVLSPFDPSAVETVGWPVSVTLPHPTQLFDTIGVPVQGSIPVKAGKNAALGFILGTIVALASGEASIPWANFGVRTTLPPGTTIGAEYYDKIEYVFEPDWWIKAVSRRQNE